MVLGYLIIAVGEILLSPVFISSTHLMCNKMQKKYKQTAALIIVRLFLSISVCVSLLFWKLRVYQPQQPYAYQLLASFYEYMCVRA